VEVGGGEVEALSVELKREALRVMETMCQWSPAIAERRLVDSLGLISSCLRNQDKQIVEAVSRMLHTSTEGNQPLAQALVSTSSGKEVGLALEDLISKIAIIPSDDIVASAFAFGALMNISLVCEPTEMHSLVNKWFALTGNLLSETSLPNVMIQDDIVQDARKFEEDDIEEDGQAKTESKRMKQWLDVVQAQTLVFDIFADLIRRVLHEVEENQKASPYWLSSISSLESGGLLAASLMFSCTPWSEETTGPKSLLLSVAKLQQSAAECAAAAFDTFQHIEPFMLKEAWSRSNRILFETTFSGSSHSETNERLTGYAQLVSAIARRSQGSIVSASELGSLSQLSKECKVEEVRVLIFGTLGRLVQSDLTLLEPISRSLFETLNMEKNFIISCEIVDVLIDLYSADERQPLFDSLNGLAIFRDFFKTFDRKFLELKRQEHIQLDDETSEKMFEVKANVEGVLTWRGA
jgi:hypothetical protein